MTLQDIIKMWRDRAEPNFGDPETPETTLQYWRGVKQCADELEKRLAALSPAPAVEQLRRVLSKHDKALPEEVREAVKAWTAADRLEGSRSLSCTCGYGEGRSGKPYDKQCPVHGETR